MRPVWLTDQKSSPVTPIEPYVASACRRAGCVPSSQFPQPARWRFTHRRRPSSRYAETVYSKGSNALELTTTAPPPGPWCADPAGARTGQP